jgi:hypothetical protein
MSFHKNVLSRLPDPIRILIRGLVNPYRFLRVQKAITNILGPQYRRSRKFLEIDLTWSCNLRCYNCSRSCEQMPTAERMDLVQIQRFIKESIETEQRWERVRLLGGEPTLHPEILEIVDVLSDWRDNFSPETRLEISTNGFGKKVQRVLKELPGSIKINNSFKVSNVQPFRSFNIAPKDCSKYRYSDYTNGCWVTEFSGIGLTPYGYYVCPVAGSIDRIFGFNLGRKHVPAQDDDMHDQLRAFCRLCGIFKRLELMPTNKPVVSECWDLAYDRYKHEQVILSRY